MKTIVSVSLDVEIVEWLQNEVDNTSHYMTQLIREDMENSKGGIKERRMMAALNQQLTQMNKDMKDMGMNFTYQMEAIKDT